MPNATEAKTMKKDWVNALTDLHQQGAAYVIVTLLGITGSTPRNNGAKMVISKEDSFDTIGGGHLEFKAIKKAHQLIDENKDCQNIEHFKLGPNLGQCCGGTATLLFESFASTQNNLMVFGAGHVAQALIPILATLPCKIYWVDSREQQFPKINPYSNVEYVISDSPLSEFKLMPEQSFYIVMTHNHQLDFDITRHLLKQQDFAYLGLIASKTKWKRFQMRYQHQQISMQQVEKMNCPIGLSAVKGKLPSEIAVSIAAEIIERYQSIHANENDAHSKSKGIAWKSIKTMLSEDNLEIPALEEGQQKS